MMTEHKNIYSALVAAQQEFGRVKKGSVNPAFKSRYADLADVAGVVIPTLSEHGVAVLHYMAGDTLQAMRTEFVHAASETRVHCDVPLIVDRQNMQGMKSATTYAKRIGLESLSGIAPDDDDGNAAAKAAPRQQEKPAPQTQKPAPRDPAAVADGIIRAINDTATPDALRALFGPDTKASAAWDWLAMDAPEHSQRVNTAKAEREAELREAPF